MSPRRWNLLRTSLVCLFVLVSASRADEDPSDPIAGPAHWAFRPLSQYPPPTVHSTDWPRSPIDSFILAKLEAANLQPAPDADRPTLLRRIHFQLVGLPPTREQVASFLEDERPDAWERMVDQLLDSPQFGETVGAALARPRPLR